MKLKRLVSMGVILLLFGCASAIKLAPEQEKQVRVAIDKAVPYSGKVVIQAFKMSKDRVSLIIIAHLLHDVLPSSSNPYVQGNYASHAALSNLAEERCARIMSNILNKKLGFVIGRIIVKVNHGVRVTTVYRSSYGSSSSSTRDVAMNLLTVTYEISGLTDAAKDTASIRNSWRINRNIIPSLSFIPG